MEVERKEFLDRGKRGLAYTGFFDGEKVLVKERNPSSDADTIRNEAFMLQKLNEVGVGPRFIAYDGRQLIREFVDGERIEDFLEHADISSARMVLRDSLGQCRRMDEAGINKFEMTHPYKHILVRPRRGGKGKSFEAVMIDFERCKHTERPKNVTQLCQYIARLQPKLEIVGLDVDAERVRKLGMRYKREGYDERVFKELLSLF